MTLECALREDGWNPYYAHLLRMLARDSKSHRVTLQYALWDRFKEVPGVPVRRLANLANLCAALVSGRTLPLSILKVRTAAPSALCKPFSALPTYFHIFPFLCASILN